MLLIQRNRNIRTPVIILFKLLLSKYNIFIGYFTDNPVCVDSHNHYILLGETLIIVNCQNLESVYLYLGLNRSGFICAMQLLPIVRYSHCLLYKYGFGHFLGHVVLGHKKIVGLRPGLLGLAVVRLRGAVDKRGRLDMSGSRDSNQPSLRWRRLGSPGYLNVLWCNV